jgi:hypothetical protein
VETHVLVDWENVRPKESDLRALVPDVTDVWIFHGPNQKVDPGSFGSFGSRATPVKIARSGKNALDFHLSFYMGYIASRHPDARFVVVSNDKGYGPMLEHAGELGFAARQAEFGAIKPAAKSRPMFSLAPTSEAAAKNTPPVAKKTTAMTTTGSKHTATCATEPNAAAKAPTKKAASKKAATKQASSKQAATKVAAPKPAAESAAVALAKNTPAKIASAKKAKGLDHVIASLKKTRSKPARQPALLAMIKSLLTAKDDDPAIQQVLTDLKSAGRVTISDMGAVQYSL